jgi:hypothetical protein
MSSYLRVALLAASCTVFAGACTRPSRSPQGELDPRILDTLQATSIDPAAVSARAAAVAHFRAGLEEMRLTHTSPTNEGDPISQWLLVRQGTATWIHDSRADKFRGQGPAVRQCPVTNLRLVAIVDPENSAVEISPADSARFRDKPVYVAGRAQCPAEDPFEIHF